MSMTRGKIEATKAAARELVIACDALLERLDAERATYNYHSKNYDIRPSTANDHSWGSPESGTLRRKSMDLTRTLANLRK